MAVRERCPRGVFAKDRDLPLRDHVAFSNQFPMVFFRSSYVYDAENSK